MSQGGEVASVDASATIVVTLPISFGYSNIAVSAYSGQNGGLTTKTGTFDGGMNDWQNKISLRMYNGANGGRWFWCAFGW